ncbi:conjugative transfer signal peptidase TraF [Bradyrhizobium sp. AZCC 1610]|uniref:S26 family signal peptidase n=1 Tax=Bradyrhizobium sp. AZCC 1610 TaxID=3117020 RepID=UPI002FEEBAA4
MTPRNRTLAVTIGAAAILAGTIVAKPFPICIWNSSESVPLGLYRMRAASNYYVTELVAVQPPEPLATYLDRNGYLPTGVPMLKRVLALPGQTVCRTGSTITIDGIEMGEARERDRRGQPLPIWHGCNVVGDAELFLMNWQSATSLDGRYFGMMPAKAVIGRVLPVWTWED